MKLTPTQAANKIREHLNHGNGIYIDGRYYAVRVKAGILQVSNFNNWFDVKPGAEFRGSHGQTLFVYEPVEPTNTLTVLWCDVKHSVWIETFQPGEVVEVVRETATQYVIAPMGFEQRVSKATRRITGFKTACGVQFEGAI